MIIEVITGVISGAAAGFIAGGLTGYFSGWQFANHLELLKKRVDSLWGSENAASGVAARQEQAAEMEAAMIEAAQIVKEEGDEKQKQMKLLALASKYPRVAMKLVRKLGVRL